MNQFSSIAKSGKLKYRGIYLPIVEKFVREAEQVVQRCDFEPLKSKIVAAFIMRLIAKLNQVLSPSLTAHFAAIASGSQDTQEKFSTITSQQLSWLFDKVSCLDLTVEAVVQSQLKCVEDFVSEVNQSLSPALDHLVPKNRGIKTVSDIFPLSGETHDGGKGAFLFYVDNRPSMVLKFRDLELEARLSAFINQKLLEWVPELAWQLPHYFCGSNFGWSNWLTMTPQSSFADAEKYYRRLGVFSGFAAAFGITDLHAENLIATMGAPVFVDLETSLHHNNGNVEWGALSTGIFPVQLQRDEKGRIIDLSGLQGIVAEAHSLETKQPISSSFRSRVTIDGRVLNPINYSPEITSGFKQVSKLILANKAEIREELLKYQGLTNRFILRATKGYAKIVDESFHPQLLESPLQRKDYISKCLSYGDGNFINPLVVHAECEALMVGDVPRFVSTPASAVISSPTARSAIELIGVQPGLTKCLAYLDSLSEAITLKQTDRIKSCFWQIPSVLQKEGVHRVDEDRFKRSEAWNKVEACRPADRATWFADAFVESRGDMYQFRRRSYLSYEFLEVEIDMFAGASGLAYALGRLPAIVPTDLRSTFATCIASLVADMASRGRFLGGAYVGLTSCVIALYANRDVIPSAIFDSAIAELQSRLLNCSMQDFQGFDLVCGVSGALAVASLASGIHPRHGWEPVAHRLFELLISNSKLDEGFRYFQSPQKLSVHHSGALCGLSHGQAGIAYSIGVYGKELTCQNGPIKQLIDEVFLFEMGEFSPEKISYPDFRKGQTSGTDLYTASWAHGSPGIALALAYVHQNHEPPFVSEFLAANSLSRMTSRAEKFIPNNFSIAAGPYGIFAILNRFHSFEDAKKAMSIKSFPQTISSTDLTPGLMSGIGAELMIEDALEHSSARFLPLLPHEMFFVSDH